MKILFTQFAYRKMRAYVNGIDYEISGFGKVEKQENGDILVSDIKIFDQVVTAGNTVLDYMASARFDDELLVAGEDPGKWRLWWHSHVNMSALFSGTDYATIDSFDFEVPEENWMLSIVTNKKNQSYARLDMYEPFRCNISDIPIEIDFLGENTSNESIDVTEEIKEKVTIRSFRHEPETASNKPNIIDFRGKNFPLITSRNPALSEEEKIALANRVRTAFLSGRPLEEELEDLPSVFYDRDGQPILEGQPIIEGDFSN